MALSNWDTLAVNESGEPTGGGFVSPLGVQVEIYKNWLYVRDEKAWEEGGRLVEPAVMEIQEGRLHYKDVDITAVRGPQNGVYCVVKTDIYPPALDNDCGACRSKKGALFHEKTCARHIDIQHKVMLGCGVYGYDDGATWLGVEPESFKFLLDWIRSTTRVSFEVPRNGQDQATLLSHFAHHEQATVAFTGEDTALIAWNEPVFPPEVRGIDLSRVLRFNQGDAYFAEHLGFNPPASSPGEAEPPILSQALKPEPE